MNVKRLFGIILTVLGIAGLIYAAIVFMDANGGGRQVKSLIVYGLLGAIFFFTESTTRIMPLGTIKINFLIENSAECI